MSSSPSPPSSPTVGVTWRLHDEEEVLRPVHPTAPGLQLDARRPPFKLLSSRDKLGRASHKRGINLMGLRLLAGQTAWPSDLSSDLDWFCSVITMAPQPKDKGRTIVASVA